MRRPLGNFLTQHAVPTAAHIIPVWSVTAAKAMCAKTAYKAGRRALSLTVAVTRSSGVRGFVDSVRSA